MVYWRAVLAHSEATHHPAHIPDYAKVDEIPFDLERRIMSVVVRTPERKDRIISKEAPEAIVPRCKTSSSMVSSRRWSTSASTSFVTSSSSQEPQPSGCVDVLPLQHITSEHHVRRGAPRR